MTERPAPFALELPSDGDLLDWLHEGVDELIVLRAVDGVDELLTVMGPLQSAPDQPTGTIATGNPVILAVLTS